MQGRHPEIGVELNDDERKSLLKISRSKKAEHRLVQRTKIILLASKKKYRNTEIGAKVGVNRDTVRHWIKSFKKNRLDGLKDKPRSGKPATFTAQERTEIMAMATRSPESEGKHFTDWSLRELADHVTDKGIVKSVSWSTVGRLLRDANIKPHKWAYWLNSKDPDFKKN